MPVDILYDILQRGSRNRNTWKIGRECLGTDEFKNHPH
jgi:hypothetical protein